jgi:pimeloyl-ACP methyl ester carboxylesterase
MKETYLKFKFKDVDIKVCVTIYGDSGKQLLCLHGFGSSGKDFEDLEKYMPGYQIVAIDWIGFGDSSKPLREIDTYDEKYLTSFLELFIKKAVQKNILQKKFSILAVSMSGLMTGMVYDNIKKHLEKLIFLNPAGFDKDVSMKFSMVMANPLLKREAFIKLITKDVFWKEFLGLHDRDKVQLWSKVGSGEFEVYLRCINTSMSMTGSIKDTHIHHNYHEIKVPVLMIGSYRDTLITEQEYLRKASKYGWDVVIIHHYDHMIISEKPKEIAKAITDFL